MLRLLALVLLVASGASAQTDSLRALPPFRIPVTENFRPPQTSAARAYAYSALATGALVALGYAVYSSDPAEDGARQTVGGALIAVGVLGGPMVGHLSLGRAEATEAGFRVKAAGLIAGGGAILLGVGALLACVPDGECGVADDVATVLVIGGAGVMATGVAAGAVVDLATIPASARWAREARANGDRAAVSPTVGLRRGAPVVGLRARF